MLAWITVITTFVVAFGSQTDEVVEMILKGGDLDQKDIMYLKQNWDKVDTDKQNQIMLAHWKQMDADKQDGIMLHNGCGKYGPDKCEGDACFDDCFLALKDHLWGEFKPKFGPKFGKEFEKDEDAKLANRLYEGKIQPRDLKAMQNKLGAKEESIVYGWYGRMLKDLEIREKNNMKKKDTRRDGKAKRQIRKNYKMALKKVNAIQKKKVYCYLKEEFGEKARAWAKNEKNARKLLKGDVVKDCGVYLDEKHPQHYMKSEDFKGIGLLSLFAGVNDKGNYIIAQNKASGLAKDIDMKNPKVPEALKDVVVKDKYIYAKIPMISRKQRRRLTSLDIWSGDVNNICGNGHDLRVRVSWSNTAGCNTAASLTVDINEWSFALTYLRGSYRACCCWTCWTVHWAVPNGFNCGSSSNWITLYEQALPALCSFDVATSIPVPGMAFISVTVQLGISIGSDVQCDNGQTGACTEDVGRGAEVNLLMGAVIGRWGFELEFGPYQCGEIYCDAQFTNLALRGFCAVINLGR